MRNQRLLFFAVFLGCFLPVLSYAQGVFIPPRTVTGTVNGITRPIAGATVTVCAANIGGIPCSPALSNTVFKDQALTVPLSNPFTTDANGNYPQAALAGGVYTITETASGFTGFSYQATVACAPGAGCTITGPLTVGSVNSVQYANATTTIAQAIAKLPANGGEVWTPPNYRETITSQLAIGSSTQPVTVHLSSDTILTVNVTGGVCAIPIANASALVGSRTVGAGGSSQGGSAILVASTANLSAVVCNADNSGAQEYFTLRDVFISPVSGTPTISSGVLDLQAVFTPSVTDNVVISGFPSTKLLRLRNGATTAGQGPILFNNIWLTCVSAAGCTPLSHEAVGTGLNGGHVFVGGTIQHASTGLPQTNIDCSAQAGNVCFNDTFLGLYSEGSFNTSPAHKIRHANGVSFFGGHVGGVGGTDVFNISTDVAVKTSGVAVVNFIDTVGWTNLVNNTITGTTIGSAGSNGRLPLYLYGYAPADAQSAPATFDQMGIWLTGAAQDVATSGLSANGNGIIFFRTDLQTFRGKVNGAFANFVLDNFTQTLTNKTLTSPIIGTSIVPTSAGAVDLGLTALPFGNLWLGTAATNNFKFQPAATTAARVVSIADPTVATSLPLFGGIGAGHIQTKRVAGCATGAAQFNTCDTTVTWTTAFADANYTATCTGDVVTSGVPIIEGHSISGAKLAASISVRTIALTAVAAQFTTIDCTAEHD